MKLEKDDKVLVFDLNKITNFIFGNPNDKTNEIEITEQYGSEDGSPMTLQNKTIKEVKVNDYTGQNSIRYDLVKLFIELLDQVNDDEPMSLGQEITLNTMEAYEFIKDISDEE